MNRSNHCDLRTKMDAQANPSGKIPFSDADVTKGIRQLRQIRDYLDRVPEHLKRIGKIDRPLNEYRRVEYLLGPRSLAVGQTREQSCDCRIRRFY